MEPVFRFTLVFAFDRGTESNVARLVSALSDIITHYGCEIFGFTVWPSLGWTKQWGTERGATVEFCAPLRRAVEFGAGIAKWYTQDCVYLACGEGAVLVDARGMIVETLTPGSVFAATNVAAFNVCTEILSNEK